ncbi:hypothetical protein ACFX1W_029797 [Malus domestica]
MIICLAPSIGSQLHIHPPKTSFKSNWIAQHNVGVMVDLDFFIRDEALERSQSSKTYNLSYPVQQGQVENWDSMERF